MKKSKIYFYNQDVTLMSMTIYHLIPRNKLDELVSEWQEQGDELSARNLVAFLREKGWVAMTKKQYKAKLDQDVLTNDLLDMGYDVIVRSQEGIDGVLRKGDVYVVDGWDTNHTYLPTLNRVGMRDRGPKLTLKKLISYERLH